MTTYDLVHLVVLASGGEIKGRTKLQKVIYFVGVLTGQIGRLGYRAHFYGPYSPDVANAVEELHGLKFLEQRAVATGVADDNGFEKTRYDYTLTEEGKQVAEEKATQWPEEWAQIEAAVRQLDKANIQDYVRLAIAAKTHLLTQQAGQILSRDVLKTKTAEHGWSAFRPDQYDEALKFLETVGLNPAGGNS